MTQHPPGSHEWLAEFLIRWERESALANLELRRYTNRLARLRERGLSSALWNDLRKLRAWDLLTELEALPDAELLRLNDLARDRYHDRERP